MKRFILAGVVSAAAVIGSIGTVSAAPAHHPNLGNSKAAHTCKHGTKADRDRHGDCVSHAAKDRH